MVVARGIKTPIIKRGDNLVEIVTNSILEDMNNKNYKLENMDIIGLTESIVSISKDNICTLDDVVNDLNNKFKGDSIGVVFPILSRNRFSLILKAIARAKKHVYLLLSYPSDEVGNSLMDLDKLESLSLKDEVITFELYNKYFSDYKHPWTKINMVNFYNDLIVKEGSKATIVLSNDPKTIKKYTKNILVSDIHQRFKTIERLKDTGFNILSLTEILNESVNGSGFNSKYGLLGSNVATDESLKLFPEDDSVLLKAIQDNIYDKTLKHVEVMVYGDGAFKDPVSEIWELADPVVSPSYTKGLMGSPSEVKLKYLAENEFKHLEGKALEDAIKNYEKTNGSASLGTTPRRYVDLLGSMMDLISGSGDRGTPVVLVQNYLKK